MAGRSRLSFHEQPAFLHANTPAGNVAVIQPAGMSIAIQKREAMAMLRRGRRLPSFSCLEAGCANGEKIAQTKSPVPVMQTQSPCRGRVSENAGGEARSTSTPAESKMMRRAWRRKREKSGIMGGMAKG